MRLICVFVACLALQKPAPVPDIFFSPTRHAVADAMLKLADVTSSDVVYDLGSGDGRIVILAAQKYGARGVGIEIDPTLVAIAQQNARDGGVADRVTFIEGDLFTADISKATVVTLYLSPSVNARLEPKLRTELKPGTRIVSQQFRIGKWTPDRKEVVDEIELLLWKIGEPPIKNHRLHRLGLLLPPTTNSAYVFQRSRHRGLPCLIAASDTGQSLRRFKNCVLEIKAQRALSEVDEAQLLNYLQVSKMKRGLLVNFGAKSLEWKRRVV